MKPIVTETRAAIIAGVRDARIVTRRLRDLAPHDVLVKILSCNLCTSEFGLWSGKRTNRPLPMTFGHEWAGEVLQVGEAVRGIEPGDFVGGSHEYDPYSDEARAGRTSEAPGVKSYDTQWDDGYFGRYEGCAEHVVQSQESIYRFAHRIPAPEAGFLEPLATVVNGLRKIDPHEGETIVVIGAGTMGVLNALVAARSGARVIVTEVSPEKVRVAERLGLEVVDGSACDAVEEVRRRTGGRGADSVVIAVGLTLADQQAFAMLKKFHGKVLFFAAGYPAPEVGVDVNKIHYGKMELYGTLMADYVDFKESCRLLGEGIIDVSTLVSARYPFDDITAAFEHAVQPGGYRTAVIMGKE